MRQIQFSTVFLALISLSIWTISCGNDKDSNGTQNGVSDAGTDSGEPTEYGDAQAEDDSSVEQPDEENNCPDDWECCTAVQLQFSIYDELVKLNLFTLEILANDAEEYHLELIHGDTGPFIALGFGVAAQNIGHDTPFHDVTEAPTDGYTMDDSNNRVIGESWRSGGAGSTGFEMSEDIYIVELDNGTYGKLEVLSAKSGLIDFQIYYQCMGGTDLTTHN